MRITEVELYPVEIPLKEPFRIAIMEIRHARTLLVRIHTDADLHGWGEANPTPAITGETLETVVAASKDFARLLLGKDPLAIGRRIDELEGYLKHNTTALSAFDMALYDIAAKAANLPLYAFLGGEKRIFWTDNTIGIDSPEQMANKALQFKEMGFRAIKIKLGTSAQADFKRVHAIRVAIGDVLPIRTDANQGWSVRTAVEVLRSIQDFNVEYCEQPVAAWNLEGLKKVRDASPVPIMADESLFSEQDAFKLAHLGCCDLFNIKLAKSGGIYHALKINAVAEAAGIPCMVGCMTETRLGLTAAAHLVSARENIRYADLDGYLMLVDDPIQGGAEYRVGEIHLPEVPGIGAEVDPVFLKRAEKIRIR
jgi:L-alanine-DL-glutamate epimerase-like enolase superfamily enzyme